MEGMIVRLPVLLVMPRHWHSLCSVTGSGSRSGMRNDLHLFHLLKLEWI